MSTPPFRIRSHGPALAVGFLATVGLGVAAGMGATWTGGIVLVVAGLAAAVFSPPGAAAFTLAMTPFAFQLHVMPGGSFSLLELGILWTVLGTGLRLAAHPQTVMSRFGGVAANYPWILVAASVLCVAAGFSLLALPPEAMRAEALREVRLVIVEPVLFTGAVLLTVRTGADRQLLIAGLVAGGLLATLVTGAELPGSGGVVANGVTRLTGPYSHPNNLALYLERIVVLLIPAVLLLKGRPKLLAIGATAVMTLAFLSTFSRGGLLAFGAGSAFVLAVMHRTRWLIVAAIAVAFAAIPALALFRDRIVDLGGTGNEPTRFAIWRSASAMVSDNPWTGVGPDQFLYQYGRRYIEPGAWAERYTSHPHNALLDFWVRLGIGGVVAFGTMVAAAVAAVATCWRSLSGDWIRLGAAASLVAAIVHGMVDNFYFLPDLALMTWITLVLLWLDPEWEEA